MASCSVIHHALMYNNEARKVIEEIDRVLDISEIEEEEDIFSKITYDNIMQMENLRYFVNEISRRDSVGVTSFQY